MTTALETRVIHREPRSSERTRLEHLAGLGAPALGLSYLVHGSGGRDLAPLLLTLALSACAAALLRVWRLPRAALVLAAWLVAAAYLVAVVHVPTAREALPRFYRWRSPGGYAVATVDLLVALAYVRGSTARRYALSVVLALGTVLQFAWAFTPWWGGGTPSRTMVGTIYWYNQYAAFLYPGIVVGLAVALRGRGPFRVAGWLAAALGTAGVLYSTSRAEIVLTAASWIAVVGCAALGGDRARVIRRTAGLVAATALVVVAMFSPPLVQNGHTPFSATAQRTSNGQTLAANGGYRLDFWHQAVTVGVHHPVDGAGYGQLATEARALGDVPPHGAASPLAHNGFLQPFADGGLLLALPLLAGTVLLGVAGLRRLPRLLRAADIVSAASVIAFGGVVVHSAIDFDWSYPALFASAAIVGALAAAPTDQR